MVYMEHERNRNRGAIPLSARALNVGVFAIPGHHRSTLIASAMAAGIRAAGDRVTECLETKYSGRPDFDVAVFYGLEGNMPQIFDDYRESRTAVYVDLGYWGRREGGRFTGYHKVSVNARHPVAYFRNHAHPADRLARFGIAPAPWRTGGRHILLAGMGEKGAAAEGFQAEEWERWAISEIRKHSERQIVYRPKPSWKKARPIAGTMYSAPHVNTLEQDLRHCWAVVTHHSNVAVDAIVAGIPAFCWGGVAKSMSLQDLAYIEEPDLPEGRDSWLADIAYTQWSVEEMKTGAPWRHLKKEGLIL